MSELPRIFLFIVLPIVVVLGLLVWWVARLNTPPDMRWPRNRRQGRRRSEREVKIVSPKK